MRDSFLIFGAPQIEQAEIDEVVATLESGWLGSGPRVARLEQEFAAYKGTAHAAALNSCTAALHLSMLAAGVEPGDEIITTPLTFCATVNAIIHAGAVPVLADIDPVTMNIDPAEIERRITDKTRGVIPVHFAGRPCDMDPILDLAQQNNLKVIEDCAHAIETEYKGRKAGAMGDFGCFSFYVTKNVISGEGGMVLAQNEDDINRIRILGLHGLSRDAWKRFGDEGYRHYYLVEVGFKYNMMDLQAAIAVHQLARVEANWLRRKELWDFYNRELDGLPVTLPAPTAPDTRHAFHLYTLLVDEDRAGISRDAFLDAMHQRNIGTGVHYISMPEHPTYQKRFGWRPEDYPNATRIGRQTVSIPLSPRLSNADARDVTQAVLDILS